MVEVKDTKSPAGGPKTADSKRKEEPDDPAMTEAANRALQDSRMNQFGDNTSSTGGANNPGQHGRDGGEINGVDNNPAPDKATIAGTEPVAEEESGKEKVRKL